jgi:hypothetical protein
MRELKWERKSEGDVKKKVGEGKKVSMFQILIMSFSIYFSHST